MLLSRFVKVAVEHSHNEELGHYAWNSQSPSKWRSPQDGEQAPRPTIIKHSENTNRYVMQPPIMK